MNKKRTIPHRRDNFNKLLQEFTNFYDEKATKLINHLRSINYSDAEIARIIGTSRQNISDKYPKEDNNA